ncbi:MAG: hypothetical protein ACLPSW_01285 [Roseiarcus sp.]
MRQRDVEAYAQCSPERLAEWLQGVAGPAPLAHKDDNLEIYDSAFGRVSIAFPFGEGRFASLYFTGPERPWDTDVDLARRLAADLGVTIRCDPGEAYPQVDRLSPVFLEIEGGRESLIAWP